MTQKTIRILAALSVIFLLQSGCAMVRTSPEVNRTSPMVKELVKTTQSWSGEFLPA